MGLFGWKTYILSQIQVSHKQSHFESLRQYYFGKPLCFQGVQSHPEDQGNFGQGLTVSIWEFNNQLELSVHVLFLHGTYHRWGDKTSYLKNVKCSGEPKKHGGFNTIMNGTAFYLPCHSGSIFSDWNLQFGQDKI